MRGPCNRTSTRTPPSGRFGPENTDSLRRTRLRIGRPDSTSAGLGRAHTCIGGQDAPRRCQDTSLSRPLPPVLLAILRWRYVFLCAWLLYCAGLLAGRKGGIGADWAQLNFGVHLLFTGEDPRTNGPGGGLHVFATAPTLHMGPLSLVGAAAFTFLFPDSGRVAAALFMIALGPLVLLLVERTAVRARGLRSALDEPRVALVTLLSGAAFLFAWADLGFSWGRLDEVLAISAAAAALWFVVNRNPLLAGTAVGLAIGSKSWGVLVLPLLAGLPWRHALRAAVLAVAIAVTIWLPFVIADSGTIDSIRATMAVGVDPASGARLLGLDLYQDPPDWYRPVQTVVALGLAALAVARGRWVAALLLAVGARLALDPSVVDYYTAALVFAALAWDLFGGRRPLPIWGLPTVFAFYIVPELISAPRAEAVARLALVSVAAMAVLGAPKTVLRRPGGHAPADRAAVT